MIINVCILLFNFKNVWSTVKAHVLNRQTRFKRLSNGLDLVVLKEEVDESRKNKFREDKDAESVLTYLSLGAPLSGTREKYVKNCRTRRTR